MFSEKDSCKIGVVWLQVPKDESETWKWNHRCIIFYKINVYFDSRYLKHVFKFLGHPNLYVDHWFIDSYCQHQSFTFSRSRVFEPVDKCVLKWLTPKVDEMNTFYVPNLRKPNSNPNFDSMNKDYWKLESHSRAQTTNQPFTHILTAWLYPPRNYQWREP